MASPGVIRAGRAFVELFADDSRLVRGLKRAQAKLAAFGAAVRSMGTRLLGMGTLAAVPLTIATKVFSGFDDQMRAVQAVIGATEQEFQSLTDTAKRLGRTTSYTAAEVAGAMLELGRAGFAPAEIDAAIDSVLSLARATGTELPASAGIASDTLRSFGLAAADMGRVADVMTATANNSAQTLTDLAEAMKYAAPVADEYGLSLEETSKALGALANFGIKGSLAGNTLKNIMLQIANPGVQERLASLGVAITDAGGDLRGVADILRDVGQAAAALPQAQRLSLYDELFGRRAIAGGAKLAVAAFDRLNNAIDNAAGTAERTARVMDSGIGGAMRRLWSAVEGVAIAVGEALAPVLSELADKLSGAAGYITQLLETNRGLVVGIAKVIAIAIAAGAALLVLGTAIGGAAKVFGVLTLAAGVVHTALSVVISVLTAMLTPIGLVVTAVLGMGAYFLYASGAAGKAMDWLAGGFATLAQEAKTSFGAIGKALASGDIALAARVLWTFLKLEWEKGTAALEKAWLNFRNFFIKIGYDAFYGLLAIGETVWHGLEVAWIETTSFLSQTWTRFTSWVAKAWAWCGNALTKAWNKIKGLFDSSFDSDAANASADQAYEAGMARIEQEKDAQLAAREQRRANEREQARRIHEATLDQIGQEANAKHAALDKEYNDRIAAGQAAVDAARAEWQKAIDQASQSTGDPTGKKGRGGLKDPAEFVKDAALALGDIEDLLAASGPKDAVRGTFNATAIQGLQASGAAERTAKATEETAKNTKTLAQKANAGGLTFD